MDENQIRLIIQEEIANFMHAKTAADRIVFEKGLQLLDNRNIQLGRTNGTMLGTAANQKLGLYGVTPIVRQSSITAPSGAGTAGVDTPARTAINALILALQRIGITN